MVFRETVLFRAVTGEAACTHPDRSLAHQHQGSAIPPTARPWWLLFRGGGE